MSQTVTTIITLIIFLGILLYISHRASKSNLSTPDDFFLANRSLGTLVLVMTTGASYFSTWTLLGSIGNYFRDGVWFAAFAAWAVVHAMFIWQFGSRIWYLGRKYNFVTPGDLMETYYKSPALKLLFAIVGMVGLIPYMLIQITGGALSLSSLTNGAIPYWIGILIMGVFVGIIVTVSGGRGAAWTDTFMGIFFGTLLFLITIIFVVYSGGYDAFKNIQTVAPHVLTNKGEFWGIMETAAGLVLGFWIMPHMWQKFYSADSPSKLAKTSIITPFWNAWLMALGALFIGILAHSPGLVPGLTNENSDTIIPLFFSSWPAIFGSVVVVGVIAAGISTINSALLSSASLLVNDVYVRFFNKKASAKKVTYYGKLTVLLMTLIVVIVGFLPAAQGFLIPIANLGYGLVMQLVPAALGPLYWKKGTLKGAVSSILVGVGTLVIINLFGSPLPLGPGTTGLILGSLTFITVSILTVDKDEKFKEDFHNDLLETYFPEKTK